VEGFILSPLEKNVEDVFDIKNGSKKSRRNKNLVTLSAHYVERRAMQKEIRRKIESVLEEE
jgi:hypothetical protein